MPRARNKTRQITVNIDPIYNDKIAYLKHTTGLTAFIEKALAGLKVDEAVMRSIRKIENVKEA